MDKRGFLGCMAAMPWMLAGCGGGNDGQVRMVHASPALGPLDWLVAGSVRASALTYGQSSGYQAIDSGGKTMSVNYTGNATPLLSASVSVQPRGKHQSWVVFGSATALKAMWLNDEVAQPSSNYTTVQILHTATQAPAVDVYLMQVTDDPAGAAVLSGSPALNTLVVPADVESGLKRLRVTTAGQPDDVLLDVSNVVCAGGGVMTLVLTDGGGGRLIGALQLDQQGAVTPLANPLARLRVVAALNSQLPVTVSAQGQALLTQVTSPAIQTYTSVTAGALALAVTVGGAVVSVPTLALTAGSDYTLLVTGTSAEDAQITLLTDNNSVPNPSTSAAVRLVHAVTSHSALGISLQVDYASIVSNLPYASASSPVALTPSITANVRVTSGSQVLATLTNQVFTAGAVYSVFAFNDGLNGTTCVLTQDR